MNEELDANSVIDEYRGIVSTLVHQAALNGALITKLRADNESLKKKGADNEQTLGTGSPDDKAAD